MEAPGPSCPSDLLYDRYLAGELEAGEREAIERHLAGCEACSGLVEARRAELSSYQARPGLPSDAAEVLRRVRLERARETERERVPWFRRLRVWGPGLVAAAAAAMVLIIFLPRQATPPGHGGDTLRIKGSFSIGAFLRRDGAVSRARSGQTFHPGDQLRFTYSARRDGHLCLVGLDARSVVTVYYPSSASRAPRVVRGSERPLPESTILDDTLGRETVAGVLCPRPFSVARVRKAAAGLITDLRRGKPVSGRLPDPGCRVARFELQKRRPR